MIRLQRQHPLEVCKRLRIALEPLESHSPCIQSDGLVRAARKRLLRCPERFLPALELA